ncbi:CPXCG motif-containing cysteine-rich protein [Hydrogenovibrio halophilus]|uniref:CPXCG motif-containing cysteine-rich protein n=1 Tax=Hydrogenovibrio halophilus TaxID=373391 RepID=UPI0003655A16|nr:CPXCG motif-containing cysteine-rich protein [Hydrogenovibrio halophilus]
MLLNLETQSVQCPHCWEFFDLVLDPAMLEQLDEGEVEARFVEDCYVCCHPIQFVLQCDQGDLRVVVEEEY